MLQASDSTNNTVTGCPLVESKESVTSLRLNQEYCYRLPFIESNESVTSLRLNQEYCYRLPLSREQEECYKSQTHPRILLQVAP